MQAQFSNAKMYKVLCPIERKDGTTFWMRVGTGFPGKDAASMNVYLDAVPLNQKGMLYIRELDAEDLQRSESRRAQRREDPVPALAGARPANDDLPF